MSLTLKDGFGRALATIGDGSALIEGIKKSINGVSHALVTAEIKKDEKGKPSGRVATGYVEESELEQLTQETVSIPANFAGLEAAMVPTRLRDQLFEITEVVESEEYVEVTALHIFYRQRENSTTWSPSKTTKYSCAAICRNVMNNVVFDLGFDMATDCTDQLWGHEFDYARKNIAECFLDPESGICKRFGLSMIRDNSVFYCLKNVGYDRGFVIEDGKNLLGVERTESIEDVVTRICPLGRDANGNLVWMNWDGKNYVDSSHIADYGSPRLEVWQTDIRVGEDDVTAANIHEKLRAAALKRFSDDKVDLPDVQMTIQFISLGDTEEYKQYRDLDRVYLYDIVHIKDSRRGYLYEAQVIGIQHNILTGVLESVTIGTPKKWNGVRTVAIWQVPEVDGRKIRVNSIRAGSFVENAIHEPDIASGAIDGRHLGGGGQSKVKELCLEQLIVENTSPDGLLHTRFAVTEGLISAEVTRATGAESSLSGAITVEAGKIQQIVSAVGADGVVTAASIVLAINESTGQSEAKIDADHVYIGNEKSTTVIAGKAELSEVTANFIQSKIAQIAVLSVAALGSAGGVSANTFVSGDSLEANSLALGGSSCTDLIKSASVSGNTLTLTYLKGDTVTFSKATTLSGAWSGGTYTVTASPQGNTRSTTLTEVDTNGEPTISSLGDKYLNQPVKVLNEDDASVFTDSIFIDASEVYDKGKASVTLSEGSWSSGAKTITASNGRTVTVSIPASSSSWTNTSGDVWRVDMSIGGATRYSSTKDFSSVRSAGYTAGYAAGYKIGWNDLCDTLGATGTGNYTRYSGTWYGTLYVAPTGGATAVNNCVGQAKSYSFSRK